VLRVDLARLYIATARYAEARPIHFVADAFELSPERVEAAVAFERQLALAA